MDSPSPKLLRALKTILYNGRGRLFGSWEVRKGKGRVGEEGAWLISCFSGSGLASIFGASMAMDGSHGNESLTYKAPKQPKKQKGRREGGRKGR